MVDNQEGMSDELQALKSICEHKLADPDGTLLMSRSDDMASILPSRSAPDTEIAFTLPTHAFDALMDDGYLTPARHDLGEDVTRVAFNVTDAGWDMYRQIEGAQ